MTNRTNGRFPWEKHTKMTAAGYARDLDATRDLPYGEKFADFFRLCEQAFWRGKIYLMPNDPESLLVRFNGDRGVWPYPEAPRTLRRK
jgi:hypothetical protein